MGTLSKQQIIYLYHHMFLPPHLPKGDDYLPDHDILLSKIVVNTLSKFKTYIKNDQIDVLDQAISMMEQLNAFVDSQGGLDEDQLAEALARLCEKGGTILLHIRAQNAGVMITKSGEFINVEAFELSPQNESVMRTQGRLRRTFPGPALSVSIDDFQKREFQDAVAQTLAKMSHQQAVGTRPKVKKAGQLHDEDRDTTHPKIITELFMNVLRSMGRDLSTPRIWKNTREEVMWHDSRRPWRRSSLWLLIRVAMQLVLSSHGQLTDDIYKMFMVFLMSCVLELSSQQELPGDVLHVMRAKVNHRLLKLESKTQVIGLDFIQKVMIGSSTILRQRWMRIMDQNQPRLDLTDLKHLTFSKDIFRHLPLLDNFIHSISKRADEVSRAAFTPLSERVRYSVEELPDINNLRHGDYLSFNLQAFESWVAVNLELWLETHLSEATNCSRLGGLIQGYYDVASQFYSGNPESLSIMLLIILELWIACDKSACSLEPSLREYDPGVPQDHFQSLLLPFKDQMERLQHAEDYLRSRKASAIFEAPSIYRDFGVRHCFSVRYFDQSVKHQQLLSEIERSATADRQRKKDELRRKQEQYNDLMRQYHQSHCDQVEVVVDPFNGFRELRHAGGCRKCSYKNQANTLSIDVFEWPLPSNKMKAKSVVFELQLPHWFGAWRDTTLFFLFDVLKNDLSSRQQPRANHPLETYSGLSRFFTSYSFRYSQRLQLLSEDKPHSKTHRRTKNMPDMTENDVCLVNGLNYRYHDTATNVFVEKIRVITDEILMNCSYKLPSESNSLQRFMQRPASSPNGPPPNSVIASQCDCPDHMSLCEYKALASMPLGQTIQWQNILLQLSAPSVDFKKVETTLFILQVAHQTGLSGTSVARAGHKIIEDEAFAKTLLGRIDEVTTRVKENWECSHALHMLIALTARILSLTVTESVRKACLAQQRTMMKVTFGWLERLRKEVAEITTDDHRNELMRKAVHIALICVACFNVDDGYLRTIFKSAGNVSVLFQCSIMIHERWPSVGKSGDVLVRILRHQWRRLLYRAYPIFLAQIADEGLWSLDDAIKRSWSAYQGGGRWRKYSESEDHWVVSTTAFAKGSESAPVHYNLLTGELLVNGLPLASLPTKYEQHPTYRILFGRSSLEVMPTVLPGMQFSSKKQYAGYTLHFGIDVSSANPPGYDLILRIENEHECLELVPSRLLREELPTAFVDGFVHFYDTKSGHLQFRSVKKPWSRATWNLSREKNREGWRLYKGDASLIWCKSETAKRISSILSPLEDHLRLHTIYHGSKSSLEIDLPNLKLGFDLESGSSHIQSRQYRGMYIDANQSIGSLIGFHNKLVLRQDFGEDRTVLLLKGPVSCQKLGDHVTVRVAKESAVKAHPYCLDSLIGRFVDNGSLQSKLFICYIHALTSYCLPDPFTRRTGTEQALSILDSAAVWSYDPLCQENVDILDMIAQITPSRQYYPANERVMQMVQWSSDIGFVAQHSGLFQSVKALLDEKLRRKYLWQEDYRRLPNWDRIVPELLERDLIRSAALRVSSFGAEDHTIAKDSVYLGRDREPDSPVGQAAFRASEQIFHGRIALDCALSERLIPEVWAFLSKISEISGPRAMPLSSDIIYDSKILLEPYDLMAKNWAGIHEALSRRKQRFNKFNIMMWLSTLAFAKHTNLAILQLVVSFFTVPAMAEVFPPSCKCFRLSAGHKLQRNDLQNIVRSALRPFHECPEAKHNRSCHESNDSFRKRKRKEFERSQNYVLDSIVNTLAGQWPCEAPVIPPGHEYTKFDSYIDMQRAMKSVEQKFRIWYDNNLFYKYLVRLTNALHDCPVSNLGKPKYSLDAPSWNLRRRDPFVTFNHILASSAPLRVAYKRADLPELIEPAGVKRSSSSCLTSLLESLGARANSVYEERYVEDLKSSLAALRDHETRFGLIWRKKNDIKNVLTRHHAQCKQEVEEIYKDLVAASHPSSLQFNLVPSQPRQLLSIISESEFWPRLSPVLFLQQLQRPRLQQLTVDWKAIIVAYGVALTRLQRAERLLNVVDHPKDLVRELQNAGHNNWDPYEYSESLLLEIESGILIRDVQAQIAAEMRDRRCGENVVMQLNMGEGKSSVIVPIVAAALANGSQLVRIIVGKPQAKQMFQMTVSKLAGFLNRRVYRLPFSRALRLSAAEADEIGHMCRECMSNGGVLLMQPEQILSLQLMSIECLLAGKQDIGRSLMRTLDFLHESSRDVVDESDENYSEKFELIYTIGVQKAIEFSPERWRIIHQVLGLTRLFIPDIKENFPHQIEVHDCRPGGFPRTRILGTEAQQTLCYRLTDYICRNGLSGFPVARQSRTVREAIFTYINKRDLTIEEVNSVEKDENHGLWSNSTRSSLLLLRGLVAEGVLAFALGEKRWRVNYGLDESRTPRTKLAVPYRAKDNPTPRSEFSHPDVVITLTTLTYYYTGLTDDNLWLAFQHLVKSDQADIEYQSWIRDAPTVSPAFRQLVGVNLEDRYQCTTNLFPHFRLAKSTIDYFLANVVFPKEMKEFPHKLSASGWDIGRIKNHSTTGFSGTNDSRTILPLSVRQLDLAEQKHTNALVLDYLLQPENSVSLIPSQTENNESDAQVLLNLVTTLDPVPRVILDVGAQVLELSNLDVAKQWLRMTPDDARTQAAVFVDENDELSVLDRHGDVEILQSSPFAKQLDVCLVFLDDAHTRGTDLKLPNDYRAAVTLGANLTKDRLVQACMRMRKLGHGQSVVFCVPREIAGKMVGENFSSHDSTIEVVDVIRWAVSETWADLQRRVSLWAVQGRRFASQELLWEDIRANGETIMSSKQAARFLEKEAQSIEERYRPRIDSELSPLVPEESNKMIIRIMERCRDLQGASLNSAKMHEEQERELSPEIEQERQIQKPEPAKPAVHRIHQDVASFVSTGTVAEDSNGFKPAFHVLGKTSIAVDFDVTQFPADLLATVDFANTIQSPDAYSMTDSYQRPVQWILTAIDPNNCSAKIAKHMVIISPFEAYSLSKRISQSKLVALHLYAPRVNSGYRSLDSLDLYTVTGMPKNTTIPRHLVLPLNLFAGQLYIQNFEEYVEICDLLGLAWERTTDGLVVAADGFILSRRQGRSPRSRFRESPIKFLRCLMSQIRRDSATIDKTHMGQIFDGTILQPSEFSQV